jgi:nucleoside-diphosphate-sugar epimerase
MRFDLTVNEFTMEMARKKHLLVFGEQFWRPYVHVFDAARAIQMVLNAPAQIVRNEVFNVGATDQNYQKKTLVELIQARVPDAVVDYVHKDEDPRDYRVSFAKIKDRLGFRLTRTVEDGIDEVLALARAGAIDDYRHPEYHNSPPGSTKPVGSGAADEPVGRIPR